MAAALEKKHRKAKKKKKLDLRCLINKSLVPYSGTFAIFKPSKKVCTIDVFLLLITKSPSKKLAFLSQLKKT